MAGVEVRSVVFATRETDILDPMNLLEPAQALVGVVAWLARQGMASPCTTRAGWPPRFAGAVSGGIR